MVDEGERPLEAVERSPRGRRLLVVLVVLVLLGTFLLAVGPRQVLSRLAGAEPRWLAVAAVATLASIVLWSEAQRALFRAAGAPVPPGRFLLAYLAGNFAKLTIPGGRMGGPAVMAYALGRETALPYESDLATTSVGKLVGFPASVVAATAALLTVAAPAATDGTALLLAALAAVVALVLAVGALAVARPGPAVGLVHALAGLGRATLGRLSTRARAALAAERVDRAVESVGGTLRRMGSDRAALALAFGLTVGGWVAAALALSGTLLALDQPAVPALALLAVPLSSLGNAVPLPAGLGGVDVALGALLVAALGLDVAGAGAVVLAYRLVSDGLVVVLGGLVTAGRAAVGDDPTV